jgi:hypothetical protein
MSISTLISSPRLQYNSIENSDQLLRWMGMYAEKAFTRFGMFFPEQMIQKRAAQLHSVCCFEGRLVQGNPSFWLRLQNFSEGRDGAASWPLMQWL